MKNLKNLFLLAGVVAFAGACEVNDDKLPLPIEGFKNSNGGIARIINYQTGAFDLNDIDNARWEIILEMDDKENGKMADSVVFFVTEVSATGALVGPARRRVRGFDKSAFVEDATTKLPRLVGTVTWVQVRTALGLTNAIATSGKRFFMEWDLVLSDGKRFNRFNTEAASIGGGVFYNSPFNATATVSNTHIPSNRFVGRYNLVQAAASTGASVSLGNAGMVFAPASVATTTRAVEVRLEVDPVNPINGRRIWMRYLNGSLGSPTFYRATFARPIAAGAYATNGTVAIGTQSMVVVVCPASTAAVQIASGTTAGAFTSGPATAGTATAPNAAAITAISDASFTLNIREDVGGACVPRPGPTTVSFTATKIAN